MAARMTKLLEISEADMVRIERLIKREIAKPKQDVTRPTAFNINNLFRELERRTSIKEAKLNEEEGELRKKLDKLKKKLLGASPEYRKLKKRHDFLDNRRYQRRGQRSEGDVAKVKRLFLSQGYTPRVAKAIERLRAAYDGEV